MIFSQIVSVDPGARYVGIAQFIRSDVEGATYVTRELPPGEALKYIGDRISDDNIDVTHVVYEEFFMYGGGPGASKSFSTMPEIRWIGQLEALVLHEFGPNAHLFKYGASVYKAATRQWEPNRSLVRGRHAYDAWRLGAWFLVFQAKWPWTVTLHDGSTFRVNEEQ